MAIVVYTCDTCKREKEFIRNIKGLDTTNKCTITHGCRGDLYQTKLLPDFYRESPTSNVVGLDDWIPRRILHNHIQAVDNITWDIVHNLGAFPAVQVFVDSNTGLDEIVPENITIIDKHTIQLKFDRPRSGNAQLVARQTDVELLDFIGDAVDDSATTRKTSHGGEVTIATKVSSFGAANIANIRLSFTTSQGSTPTVTYTIDDQPNILSAWSDYDTVIINGSIYTIRSFNVVTSEMTTGVINNGATLTFNAVDTNGDYNFRDINGNDEVLILLASDPQTAFDKTFDKCIDVTGQSSQPSLFGFFYDNGELYTTETLVKSVYPHIRST